LYDVVIIGGGIVGLATAKALIESTRARVIVIEAESRIGEHQTGHNSGVIHAGLYYKPGSLKAKNCVVGREAMYEFCQEHNIPHERCGKLVVATCDAELPALEELERRGMANGLDQVRRVQREALTDYEPHVAGVAGLWVPYTGIIDFRQVAEKYAELIRHAGGEVRTGASLQRLRRSGGDLVAETTEGAVTARNLIACCGLEADRVARLCGVDPELQIIPFRGEYYELVPGRTYLVKNLIYPVPDPGLPFLGVHFTRRIRGGVEAGPNAVLALARHGYAWRRISPRDVLGMLSYRGWWRMGARYWRTGIGEMHRSLSKRAFVAALARLVPQVRADDLVQAGAGVRAQAVAPNGRLVDDFHVVQKDRMIHVLNAPSPAATASLSIGRHIADLAAAQFEIKHA
jgi:(S)-2-hydroxyglutarate dehydrogenase